jgi:hypothetical protein
MLSQNESVGIVELPGGILSFLLDKNAKSGRGGSRFAAISAAN